jgi:integrase
VNYLKVFKTLVNHAIKDDTYKGSNPILNHLIPAKSGKKKVPLRNSEIWKLNNLKPIKQGMTEGMYHALNVFMFSFWSRGLRISDVLQLKYKHFMNGYFSIKMNKTKEVVNVPLTINNVERIIPYIEGSTSLFEWNKKKYFISSVFEDEFENYIGVNKHDELFSFYSIYMRHYFSYEKLLMERVSDYNSQYRSKDQSKLYFHEDFEFDSKEMSILFKNSEIIEEKWAYEKYFEHRERYLQYCMIYFKNYCKPKEIQDQYVFPFLRGYDHLKGFKLGEKVSAITALINKNLYKISERFDLPKFTTHYARHSFTSLSKSIGVDIYDLRTWLGHTSVKNTEIYVNTLDEPTDDPHSLRLYDSLNS